MADTQISADKRDDIPDALLPVREPYTLWFQTLPSGNTAYAYIHYST